MVYTHNGILCNLKKKEILDFPGVLVVKNVVKNLPANEGDTGRSLAWEDFTCHWAAKLRALEPVVRNKREAPQVESSPHLPQLEKAH